MSDTNWQWTCYEVKLWDKSWSKSVIGEIIAYVYGMTEDIAREKLIDQYPADKYEIKEFNFHHIADPLSNPNSYKGAKGPNDD